MAYIYNLIDTWNNAGTTFTAIKMNVTDTNSSASSLLMDLQVGGSSKAYITKSGQFNSNYASYNIVAYGFGNATISNTGFGSGGSGIIQAIISGTERFLWSSANYTVGSATNISWASSANVGNGGSPDVFLSRRGAANLRLGDADAAAPVAQTLSVQSVIAGTANTAGANLTFTGSQGTGTGAGGSIIFQVAPAGSNGTAQNALAAALTLNSDKTSSFGGDIIGPQTTFAIKTYSTSSFEVWLGSFRGFQINYNSGLKISNYMPLGWTTGTDVNTVSDLQLFRDAAYILAQRYTTNAQTYRLYGTYTDTSNYERGYLATDSNGFTIGTEALGTGTKRPVRIIGPSLASAESVSILELSQTWNTSGTPTGLKLNVTDTASNASSLLMDLGTGGGTYVSRFNIRKDGYITMADSTIVWGTTGLTLTRGSGINMLIGSFVSVGQNGVTLANGTGIAYTASASPSTAQDLFLTRRGAANLRFGAADGAAPVAQTLSVQSVIAGTANTAGANWTFTGSQGTGTGAGGSIIFQVAAAGSSGSAQNALSDALTIVPGASGDRFVVVAGTASTNYQGLGAPAVYFGGGAAVLNDPNQYAMGQLRGYNSSTCFFATNTQGVTVASDIGYRFSATTNAAGTADIILARDAANTLALRNGTNAQTFNLYGTYTDASNYERLVIKNDTTNGITFNCDAAGTGGVRGINFQTSGLTGWSISPGRHFLAGADNAYDIGASASGRPRNVFVAGTLQVSNAGLSLSAVGGNGFYTSGGGYIIFKSAGVLTLSDASDTSFNRLQFGGTTSSFPALKRSSTTLQVRLADDTGFANLSAAQVTIPLQTLTDGANVAWNCNSGAKAKVTLAGNRTIDAVTNAVEGTSYMLWVIQDATGSRTVTWTTSGAGSFDFGTEGTPVLTTTASAADALGFEAISIGGTLKLRFMGIKRGFA